MLNKIKLVMHVQEIPKIATAIFACYLEVEFFGSSVWIGTAGTSSPVAQTGAGFQFLNGKQTALLDCSAHII